MQQSNFIFAMLLIAYIIFITVRGELPAYIAILRGGGQQAGSAPAGGGTGNAVNTGINIGNSVVNNPDASAAILDIFTSGGF